MKDIFSYNPDIEKNAYMNWRTNPHQSIHNMVVIADGFMKSAIMLAEDCLKDNMDNKADVIIYPILFNANHAIELYLKAITWTLNIVTGSNRKIEGSHNIQQILSVVKSRVYDFETDNGQKKQFDTLISNTENYINELFGKIQSTSTNRDNMDFSRYPFDQKYNPHFYIETFDNVVIDLENFVNRFKQIADNLSCISGYYLYTVLEAPYE